MRRISPGFLLLSCVIPLGAQITLNPTPTRVLGQNSLAVTSINPNLVEGREFFTPEGIALDTSSNPPALYVCDYNNNRVLGFRSATSFANGQKADLVLGQIDFASTFAQGPGRTRSIGFTGPTSVAVDATGNVYVLDAGNNRILRFPKPFAQTGDQNPDLVIGQQSFTTSAANLNGISANTLNFSNGTGGVLLAFMKFDSAGNLWVADSGNNRILRFNASVLGSDTPSGPSADLVLGQPDFVSGSYTAPSNSGLSLTTVALPTGIAFDSAGRLYVDESLSSRRGRILIWTPPFSTGQAASRVLGVSTDPNVPATSEFQLNIAPGDLFAVGDSIGVADTFDNRLLIFPPYDQQDPNSTSNPAVTVVGQANFSSSSANRGQPTAQADRLAGPAAAVAFNNELYISDSFSNRVIVMPRNGDSYNPATRVLGQDTFFQSAINLIEGREFNFGVSSSDAGLTVDINATPPHLYVADPGNNRILGFNDLRNLSAGAKADIVIGQPDFQQSLINYPNNDPNRTNSSGLYAPTGLVTDLDGNLYVADRGNSRVLRFPKPFANYVAGTPMQADLVLGQSGFSTTKITDATSRTMAQPYGVAYTLAGGLLVSDVALNRVLYFQGTSVNLRSGMAASTVFGQTDFNSSGSGSGPAQLAVPLHISTDVDDRLYVVDAGNKRISIFDHAPTSSPGQPAAQFLTAGLTTPRGVYVSPATGDIWVADATVGAIRYPQFNNLVAANFASNATIKSTAGPIAVTQDAWGNLFLADAIHRVSIYYPGLSPLNAANYLRANQLAPGMIAAMYSTGNFNQFGGTPTNNPGTLPLPKTLNGVQVLFNGSPVPLFYADPNQINFQVPISAPQSGLADIQVIEVATGRVLGDTTVLMTPSQPGLFTQAGNGSGAAAALNEDGTVNSQNNPAMQGSVVTFFGTGQGFVNGAPPDGDIANNQVPTTFPPLIILNTGLIDSSFVKYSGLAPTLVGVWQINVQIPNTVISTATYAPQIVAIQNSVASGGGGLGRPVIIYVKQRP